MIIRTLTNKPTVSKEAFYFLLCEVNTKNIQADARHIQPTYGFFKAFSGPRRFYIYILHLHLQEHLFKENVTIQCINANFARNFALV